MPKTVDKILPVVFNLREIAMLRMALTLFRSDYAIAHAPADLPLIDSLLDKL